MEIIYEDNDIMVCYKPAGIATETSRLGQQDMVSLLRNCRAAKGEPPYIGMVHRLDQPVEGLLVFGKTKRAASELSRQVAGRSIGKYYYAVGQKSGECALGAAESRTESADWTTLTDYIIFEKKRNLSMIADSGVPEAKRAKLDYRIIGHEDDLVCFDIALHTGRHHQIRLQMAHHGFPLVGDSKYHPRARRPDAAGAHAYGNGGAVFGQLALCSYRLIFAHPTTQKVMDFSIRPHNPIFDLFIQQ